MFIEVPLFLENSPALKNSWLRACVRSIFYGRKGLFWGGNASHNEDFRSTILQPFQFEPDQETTCVNESHEKETTAAVVRRYSSN